MTRSTRIGGLACSVAVVCLMDPRLAAFGPASALVCLAIFLLALREGIGWNLLAPLIGLFAGAIAFVGYGTGADSYRYIANTVSLIQDRDFDLGNQFLQFLDARLPHGPTGMALSAHPVGNAFIWVFPVLVAHLYALLTGHYALDFASPPYLGAMIVTNLVVGLGGALALARMLARDVGQTTALLAVGGAIFTSSIAYYLTTQPLMVHGLTFGLSCLVIVTTRRAVETDRANDWRLVGALIGLITACRFQAFVLFVLVLIVPIASFKAVIRRVALVVPPLLLMVVPQLVVWFHMFGTPFAIPQGPGFMTWQPTHWLDTLISADRGLFNWHPVLLIGLCGLFLARPVLRRLSIGGLVAFGLTVWTNGQLSDFAGSDSFGSRRYDLIIPFFAIGMARLFAASRPFLIRRPLALPSLLIVAAALWNASFAHLYGAQRFRQAAPLDELAQAQIERLHEGARSLLGSLGPRVRFRVYDAFVGLYAYRNYRPGGDFDLASLEPRFLGGGWSDPQWWDDGQTFRYVLYPKGCLFVPLEEAFDLRGFVLARSPARIRNQRVTLTLNGRALVELPLPPEWTELPFQAPKAYWQAGLNEFCIVAKEKRPGDESGDLAYAAGIVRVQLP